MKHRTQWAWTAVALTVAGAVGVCVACMLSGTQAVHNLDAYVRWIAQKFSEEDPVQTLKTTWQYETNTGSTATKCIETTRLPDETAEAWDDRHEAAVAAAQASCPPI